MLNKNDFIYQLPQERIAQTPLEQRDKSKLLTLNRTSGEINHKQFGNIVSYFKAGDIIVANNSRVIPARLFGRKATGGKIELLLLEHLGNDSWKAMVGGKKLVPDTEFVIVDSAGQPTGVSGTVTHQHDGPLRTVTFDLPTADWLDQHGHVPLPPYIYEQLPDSERYQTIYSRPAGSAAAPTAGLHFTPEILLALREKGVLFETVTLHVGLDTFKPLSDGNVADHQIHSEWATLSIPAAERINQAKLAGGRLFAVGTTSVRTLETAALRAADVSGSLKTISEQDIASSNPAYCPWKPVSAFEGPTDLYIYPGYRFRVVDGMITNFHMPGTSLMLLVSAFAGRESIMQAYESALANEYRFLSLGDAMLIHP